MCVCVCVCVCARACVLVRACACVRGRAGKKQRGGARTTTAGLHGSSPNAPAAHSPVPSECADAFGAAMTDDARKLFLSKVRRSSSMAGVWWRSIKGVAAIAVSFSIDQRHASATIGRVFAQCRAHGRALLMWRAPRAPSVRQQQATASRRTQGCNGQNSPQ